MPYTMVQKDGKHCVAKKADGHVIACHDTAEEARKQMAALMAQEPGMAHYAELNTQKRESLAGQQFALRHKDASGNTVEKLPIHDEAHVRNAIARFGQTDFPDATSKQEAARKILAAARRLGIDTSPDSDVAQSAGVQKHDEGESSELQTVDLPDQEIFATGTYKGNAVTDTDLDELVRAHQEIGSQLQPYLKVTHAEGPVLKDVPLRFGAIDNLRKVGSKLMADLKAVPKKLADFIKAGALPRQSAEIYHHLTTQDGKTYPRALRAVALLGAQQPALWESLGTIRSLYTQEASDIDGQFVIYEEDNPMPPELVQYEQEIQKRDAELAETRALLKKYEDDLKKATEEKRSAEIAACLEKAKKEGFLIPKAEPVARALIQAMDDTQVVTYTEGTEPKAMPPRALFEQFLKLNGKVIEYGEMAAAEPRELDNSTRPGATGIPVKNAGISNAIKTYALDHDLSFVEAHHKIQRYATDRDLTLEEAVSRFSAQKGA